MLAMDDRFPLLLGDAFLHTGDVHDALAEIDDFHAAWNFDGGANVGDLAILDAHHARRERLARRGVDFRGFVNGVVRRRG